MSFVSTQDSVRSSGRKRRRVQRRSKATLPRPLSGNGPVGAQNHHLKPGQERREETLDGIIRWLDYERKRFCELFESMPVAYALLDENGIIEQCNGRMDSMLGFRPGTLTAIPILRFVQPEDAGSVLAHFRRSKSSREPVFTQVRLRRADKRYVPVELISLHSRKMRGLFRTAIVDASSRIATEEKLAQTHRSLQNVLDTLQGIVWEADAATLDIVFVSQFAERLLGYPTSQWFQERFWERHLVVDDRERVMRALSKALAEKTDLEIEYRVMNAERRVLWLHDRIRILYDEHRPKLLGIAVDITRQKQIEQELAEARDNLEERVALRTSELQLALSELESFSYSLSHDLRAPLRAIKGYSELLESSLEDKLEPQERNFLKRMQESAIRMDGLIQDVLQYNRVLRAPLDLHPVDLEKLVNGVLRDYPNLQPPAADIEVLKPLLPVLGHEAFLTQCVSNLLGNAVKFVSPGQQPRVRVATQPANSEVEVLFEDNGIGIGSEEQENIFGIFHRGRNSQAFEGTGIGLAIVRKAIERMGGRVGVQSTPGKGSRFWLRLPAA